MTNTMFLDAPPTVRTVDEHSWIEVRSTPQSSKRRSLTRAELKALANDAEAPVAGFTPSGLRPRLV